MIFISNPAQITMNFYSLGPYAIPAFFLDGDHPVIFDSGVYIFGEHYLKEINRILGDRKPEYLFLSHVHFDHCGSAGYLKRMLPGLKVGASSEGSEIIKKPNAINLITKLNTMGETGKIYFEPFTIDIILKDGDIFEISKNLSVKIVKTPGHTRDMISFYIPEQKILIPSESVGVPGMGEYIFSEFLIDYNIYMDSLKKLKDMDIEVLIMAHGLYYTGDDARNFIPRAIKCTQDFRAKLEALLLKYGDDYDTIASIIKKEEYDPGDIPKQPVDAYMLNLRAKIKAIKRHMSEA
jgi:2-aminobenzoylacetyl-CoA thioesterase